MFSLLKFLSRESSSKSVAKERLTAVLAQDRVNCSPELISTITKEMLKAISMYVDIDSESEFLSVQLSNDPDSDRERTVLIANIPIKSMKRVQKSLV
jgi:cell division topological specificity factor